MKIDHLIATTTTTPYGVPSEPVTSAIFVDRRTNIMISARALTNSRR
jgi:hypothetical protein